MNKLLIELAKHGGVWLGTEQAIGTTQSSSWVCSLAPNEEDGKSINCTADTPEQAVRDSFAKMAQDFYWKQQIAAAVTKSRSGEGIGGGSGNGATDYFNVGGGASGGGFIAK